LRIVQSGKIFAPVMMLLLMLSSPSQAQWFKHEFTVMGTAARVELELASAAEADALMARVEAEMRRIDRTMSPYIETSELSQVNNNAGRWVEVSTELYQLIHRSLAFSKLTGGAFDISFASVGFAYDYRLRIKPTDELRQQLQKKVNYRNVILSSDGHRVKLSEPGMKIDLGGIAKGHAVDKCIEILRSAGVKNGLVNAGGDTRIIGRHQQRPWYIGIRHPRDEQKLIANLPLENLAISTSGDYERFFEQDGKRYHHIINPKSGDSARLVQSVTILANDSTTADALSTSVFVLGVEKGMALINSLPEVSAIIIDAHGKMFLSTDLMPADQ